MELRGKIRAVAVLKGGISAEREVSLISGAEVAKAVRAFGVEVTEIDAQPDLWTQLEQANPDVIFNALHGFWGEDGTVQGILDSYGKPYTHSGVAASALAMDKNKAKIVLRANDILVPDGRIIAKSELLDSPPTNYPYVVKPNAEGSSVGVFIVLREGSNQIHRLKESEWDHIESFLVEEFIDGKELCVTILGDQALAVTEIQTNSAFYDYQAKYEPGGSAHIVPADIPSDIYHSALKIALRAHSALGCESLSRSDFRYDFANEKLVLLEVNTQPGMTPTSLAPEQAAYKGLSFTALVKFLLEDAVERFEKKKIKVRSARN